MKVCDRERCQSAQSVQEIKMNFSGMNVPSWVLHRVGYARHLMKESGTGKGSKRRPVFLASIGPESLIGMILLLRFCWLLLHRSTRVA